MDTILLDKLTVFEPGALTVALPLDNALIAWADSTTDSTSERRQDLLRDKTRAVGDFFSWVGKAIDQVTPADVKGWQRELEGRGLAQATIYAMISRVSSFYEWILKSPDLASWVMRNPVTLARPKAPRPYQAESTKALDNDQVRALLRVVKANGDVISKRDYALLLFYLLTGLRRAEVAGLRWGDVKINCGLIVTVRVKGGEFVNREIIEPAVKEALLDYLRASGRLDKMTPESPLWTRHDRGGKYGDTLTSHAISKAMKGYATSAGLEGFQLHQFRHTYARMVAEESGSLIETQDALGHRNLSTTRVYVQRIGVKRDRFSVRLAEKLNLL